MKQLFPALLILALAIVTFGCKSGKKSTATSSVSESEAAKTQTEPQMLATILRTPCYGQCPIYKATFMDNGEVIYIGKRFVENIGTYKGLIEASQIQLIKEKITEYDYFSLDSLYPTQISDFPSCITEARLNGNRKKVIDRHNAPDNLKAFEKFLDSVLEDVALEKVSDETDLYNSGQ